MRNKNVFSSFSGKLIWRISPIVVGEILKVFVMIMIAAEKHALQDGETLKLPIQIMLSPKQEIFSDFFIQFPESASNFKHFEKKDDCHS